MWLVDYDKSFSFLQLVTVSYALLATLTGFVLVFPALHRGEGVSNVFQFKFDGTNLVDYCVSCTASREIMGLKLECVAQFYLLGSIVLSSCVAIAAAYFGIHWHFCHRRPGTHLKCTFMVQDKFPKILACFPAVVVFLGLTFATTIFHEIVLFVDLMEEVYSKNPNDNVINRMEAKITNVGFFFLFNSIIFCFSIFMHNLFYNWEFFFEMPSFFESDEDLSDFNDLRFAHELIRLARRETTNEPPPEYSSLETVV